MAGVLGVGAALGVAACGEDRGSVEIKGDGTARTGATGETGAATGATGETGAAPTITGRAPTR